MAAAWPYGFKSIFWETLFLDQLHDYSLLPSNSFLDPFMKSKFQKKISWHQNNFIFELLQFEIFSKIGTIGPEEIKIFKKWKLKKNVLYFIYRGLVIFEKWTLINLVKSRQQLGPTDRAKFEISSNIDEWFNPTKSLTRLTHISADVLQKKN